MTQTQEFSGKDVTVAVKNACAALSLSKNELKYDVISEGTSGIFGIVGRKDAKIKVLLPELPDQAQTSEGIKSFVDEAFGEETRLEEKPKPKPKPKKTQGAAPDKEKISKEPEPDAPESFAPKKPADDKPADDKPADDKPADDKPADEKPVQEKPAYDKPEPVDVTQESIDLGIESLQKMANLITDDTIVSAHTEEDRLTLKIEGGNAGILIGRKGQTLDAMQFLADKIINRKSEGRVRVKVDIEGYMETRKANLKHLAFKMADKAKKTGRPATINQMSAQDRRIVHLALKDDTAVRTQSMGDGYYRRLVIFPKKKTSFRGKRQPKR